MESETAGKPKLRQKPCTLFCGSAMLISNIKKKVRNAKLSQEPSQGATHVAVCWEISCCDGFLLHESLFMRTRTSLTYLMQLRSTRIKSVDFILNLRQTWSRLLEKVLTIIFFGASHNFHFYMSSGRFYKEIINIIALVFFLLIRSGGIRLLMIPWFSVILPATWSDLREHKIKRRATVCLQSYLS